MPILGANSSSGSRPSAPVIGSATDGGTGTTASIVFTPSTYIGKGTIAYTATSSPGSITATSSSSPITVTGLTTGTAYTFTVQGTTNYGTASAVSSASNSVTPANPSSFESIASLSGSGVNTITFSSIPSIYKALQIRFMGLTTGGADSPRIRFNGDTGSNYAYHYLVGSGSGAPFIYALPSTDSIFTSQNNAYNQPIVGIIDIQDYASTTKNKTVRSITGYDTNGANGGRTSLYSGLWMNTNAISSLTLFNTNGEPWNSASSFALYGIKG